MLILLPILAFALTVLVLLGVQAADSQQLVSVRRATLQAWLLLGGYMVMGSELLSLFRALTTIWVSILWGLGAATVFLLGWRKRWLRVGITALRARWRQPDGFGIAAFAILGLVLALLLLVALKAPSNNADAIQYHMARVMHWAQNATLAHYPTAYAPQVLHPINAELMILHARLLFGDDRLANVIQWLSLVGGLIGVSAIAGLFSGGKLAQWLSIAFLASAPLAVLEATSAQNDLVTSFYFICLLYFIFLLAARGPRRADPLWIGLALGLGLQTKATFYPYAFPPMVFLLFEILRKMSWKRALPQLLMIAAISIVLNLGVWWRNVVSFGSPLGEGKFVASNLAVGINPGPWVGGLARNLAENLATPNDAVNHRLVVSMRKLLGPIDPPTKHFGLKWGWNHEDLAGNPLHLLLAVIACILLVAFRRRLAGRHVLTYLIVVLASYIMLSGVVGYIFYGVRLQLPFFAAFAPLFGVAIEALDKSWLSKVIAILLLLAALPWVLFNRTRPLIAMRPSHDAYTIPCLAGCTIGSILVEPPETIMFAISGKQVEKAYVDAMGLLKSTSCQNIGLMIDSSDLEYVYWWLLDAPQSGRRLESLNPPPELQRYLDPDFEPCAIICTACGKDQPTLNGLELAGEFDKIKIYLQPEYRP